MHERVLLVEQKVNKFGFTYGYDDAVTAAMQERTYQWMDIVFVDFGEISGDCLLRKSRPAIVLSGTAYNESSPAINPVFSKGGEFDNKMKVLMINGN